MEISTGQNRKQATMAKAPHSGEDTPEEAKNLATIARGKHRSITHWTMADIEWSRIDHDRARNNPLTAYVVAAASFIETAADLYTTNLVKHFPDPRAQQWLLNFWQPEELQHGLALRTYVETVWPELDWEHAYSCFFDEYSQLCTVEELESSRALEMVARCVVETGTSSFYRTLQHCSDEPVLESLADLIRKDEVSHYNHFRHFFAEYQKLENISRAGIIRSLYRRLTEVETEDVYISLKHAWLMHHAGKSFDHRQFTSITHQLRHVMVDNYPYRTALKMLLQPLELNRTLVKISMPILEQAARKLMFRLH